MTQAVNISSVKEIDSKIEGASNCILAFAVVNPAIIVSPHSGAADPNAANRQLG